MRSYLFTGAALLAMAVCLPSVATAVERVVLCEEFTATS